MIYDPNGAKKLSEGISVPYWISVINEISRNGTRKRPLGMLFPVGGRLRVPL